MRRRWLLLSVIAACGDGGGGSSCPDFATIVDGTFTRTGTTLTWTMRVTSLPATIPFDQADVPDSVLEYRWGVNVDLEGDGHPDFEVSSSHFKSGVANDVSSSELTSHTQNAVWQIVGAGASLTGTAQASLSGSTFTWVVDTSDVAELDGATSADQTTWVTHAQLGAALTDQCDDSWQP